MDIGMANKFEKVSKMIRNMLRFARRANQMTVICFLVLSGMFLGAESASGSTIWDNTVVPAILSAADTNAVELGAKFKSNVDGFITGLRFYKSSANTGTHGCPTVSAAPQATAMASSTPVKPQACLGVKVP